MPVHNSKLGQVVGQAAQYDPNVPGLPGSALNMMMKANKHVPAMYNPQTIQGLWGAGKEIGTNIGQAIFGQPDPGPQTMGVPLPPGQPATPGGTMALPQTTGPPLPAPQPAGGTMALPPPPWQEAPNIPGVSVAGSSVPGIGYPKSLSPPSPPPYESTPFPGAPPIPQENIIPPDMSMAPMAPPPNIQLDPNIAPLPTSPGLKDLKKMTRPLQGSIFSQPDKFPL